MLNRVDVWRGQALGVYTGLVLLVYSSMHSCWVSHLVLGAISLQHTVMTGSMRGNITATLFQEEELVFIQMPKSHILVLKSVTGYAYFSDSRFLKKERTFIAGTATLVFL